MPTFEYQPIGGSNAAVIEATDRAAAVRQLREQGITPVSLKQVERRARRRDVPVDSAAHSMRSAPTRTSSVSVQNSRRRAMSRGEMASFIRELATAVMAGLPLVQALKTIARQGHSARQRAMLDHVIKEVEHGRSLGDAANSWGPPFTELTISLIRAGEMSGRLGDVLEQAANLLDRDLKLRRTLMSGLLYPAILGVLITIAVAVIVTVIVPRILAPLQGQLRNVKLPWPTRVVTGVTDFATSYWWLITIVLVGGILWLGALYRNPTSRLAIDRFLLKTPVLGRVLRDVAVARFTRTLCTLVSSGLPALTALRATKATLGNRAMEVVIEQVCDQVSSGKTIADPMEKSGFFPPLLTQIVGVGERSGRLPQMLGQAANVFEDRTETSVKVFTTVFPPILIIIAAMIVGFVITAILLPLIQLQELIG
jgi:general secretion pathway protein F